MKDYISKVIEGFAFRDAQHIHEIETRKRFLLEQIEIRVSEFDDNVVKLSERNDNALKNKNDKILAELKEIKEELKSYDGYIGRIFESRSKFMEEFRKESEKHIN